MDGVRLAASFEGLIILAVIYFVLNLLSRAGKKQGRTDQPPAELPDEPTPTQEEALSLEKILQEIERVKREKAAERKLPPTPRPEPAPKRPPPPPMRRPEPVARQGRMASPRRQPPPVTEGGPLGRQGKRRLESHEEVEERQSYDEGRSLEVEESLEVLDDTRFQPLSTLDHDDEAEAIVQRRVKAAELRNRAHSEQDHRDFHKRVTGGEIGSEAEAAKAAAAQAKTRASNLRRAVVWREILGPPKALGE